MFRPKGFVRSSLCALLVLLCLSGTTQFAPSSPCSAQPPADAGVKEQKEVEELLASVEDIGELKFLNLLQLTAEQLDKLISAVNGAQAEYNAQLALFNQTALKKISSDILSARKLALSGKPVPTALNDRINKAIDAHLKNTQKRKEIHDKTLSSLGEKFRGILTAEQIATAAKTAKEETEKTKQGVKGTEAQWFNAYVSSVVMGYPRILPLLKEMRTAKESGTDTGS